MLRVDVVLGGIGPQPADRRLAVLDLRGKNGVLAKPVVDAGHGVALGRKRYGRDSSLCFRPASHRRESRPSAAAGLRLLGQVEIQAVSLVAALDVRKVPHDLYAFRHAGRCRPLRSLLATARFIHANVTTSPITKSASVSSLPPRRLPGQNPTATSLKRRQSPGSRPNFRSPLGHAGQQRHRGPHRRPHSAPRAGRGCRDRLDSAPDDRLRDRAIPRGKGKRRETRRLLAKKFRQSRGCREGGQVPQARR